MMVAIHVLRIAAFVALWAGAAVLAAPSVTEVHTLANGMRVIVKTDRRAPVVVSMVWYKVGSVDEFNGTTGVAHVLEHMMFKGTRSIPAGGFSKTIATAGGRENAFTSRDYTGYFQTLHKSKLPLSLRLEADRMVNLTLSRDEFAREIKVVMEERRLRTEDQPRALVYEQLMATALGAHPYRRPVIGWMNDLENMRVEDARVFYRRWYAPNNAILVVVGDVEPRQVFDLAKRYFGHIRPKTLPERKPQEEPQQLGIKRLTVKAPAEQPYVLMAYRVPVLRDPDSDWEPYALDMLAGVLDGNEAARLNRTLVRGERLASSASAGYDEVARGPGMFYLSAVPTPGKTVEEAEQGLRRELQKIAAEGVTEEELKRIKAQIIAGQIYQRDSMFFQARAIGAMESVGLSYRTLDLMIEKLKQVTPDQVQAVAKKYFTDDTLTVAYLDPQPVAKKQLSAPPPGLRHVQ
ncbi:MAG: insulinase family protein [Burkholderiales bacterium]|nr:insulinase family protein [Burkholderiales bacterium]